MKYGDVRVSTIEQCEDRQLIAMQNADVDHIFLDKMSGKDFNRPEYQKMMEILKPDDLLVISSIDRLGRNYTEIQNQWRILTKEKGVQILVLDMPLLDTRQQHDLIGTLIADLVLQILSFVAETERDNIKERQKQGIAAAKARNVQFGRPPIPIPDNFDELVKTWRAGEMGLDDLLSILQMSKSTLYRRLNLNRSASLSSE